MGAIAGASWGVSAGMWRAGWLKSIKFVRLEQLLEYLGKTHGGPTCYNLKTFIFARQKKSTRSYRIPFAERLKARKFNYFRPVRQQTDGSTI